MSTAEQTSLEAESAGLCGGVLEQSYGVGILLNCLISFHTGFHVLT